MQLNPADINMLSALFSALLGTMIVPYVVAVIVHSTWSNNAKRATAVVVSFAVAILQFWLEQIWTGKTPVGSLAVMVPIIYVMATTAYNRYWKPILGPIEELDVIGKIFNRKDDVIW